MLLLLILPAIAGCADEDSSAKALPAKAEVVAHEADLLRLTLTRKAQQRLGIKTVRIGEGNAARIRETSGEVVIPPTGNNGVPTNSTSDLLQIGLQQAASDGEVNRTQALARLARVAYDRAAALVEAEAGSVRARDEAAAALATAQAAVDAAKAQRRLLGPSISSMGRQGTLWIRVPVFGSDVGSVQRGQPAMIRPLGDGTATPRSARPVQAPPSANAAAGTVDLYYAIGNRDGSYRVGQSVSVMLPVAGIEQGLSVPAAAIVRDIYGGEWVYQNTAPDTYVRKRIAVANISNGQALLARGLERGALIVTDGAAELFGTEFGTPH